MKRCPYCEKEIQDQAEKCEHCGKTLDAQGTLTPDESAPVREHRKNRPDYDDLDATVARDRDATILAGQYRIVRKIGEGGMGVVYLAEDIKLYDRKVVIKVLPPLLVSNARAVESLRKEALTAIELNHPNIIRLYGFHTDGETKFLVMEYIEGKTLEQALDEKEKNKFTLEELLPMAEQIAAGLDYAHNRKVLHRDLKPSNIMVGDNGSVKLLDFGIAREMKDSYTRVTGRETSGTLPYMSPQQLLGGKPDASMDIYSFGALLYECLSGHPPFYTGDIRRQIEVRPVESIEGLPAEVNSALRKALSKEPDQRPKKPSELVAMIRGKKKATPLKESPDDAKTVKITQLSAGKKKVGAFIAVFAFIVCAAVLVSVFDKFRTDERSKFDTTPPSLQAAESAFEEENRLSKSLYDQAQVLITEGEYAKAVDVIDRLFEKYPVSKYTLEIIDKRAGLQRASQEKDKGFISEAKMEWHKAIEAYTNVLVIMPDDAQIKEKLATCQHNLYLARAIDDESKGDLDSAIDNYSKALSYKQVASTQMKLEAAKKNLQDTIGQRRKAEEYLKWIEQAQAAQKDGDLSVAVKFYEKAEKYIDDSPSAEFTSLVPENKTYTKASLRETIEILKAKINEEQKQFEFNELLEYARARDNKKEGKDALKALAEALTLYPDNEEALALKNKIYRYYSPLPGDVFTNSVGMKLVYIPAGEFIMGSHSSETDRADDEGPQHKVKITKGFYMGVYEVTQAQYSSVMADNPSNFKGDNRPVEQVSWNDAMEFCRKLSREEGRNYRLPTEAEWEYACRAGTTTPFHPGGTISADQANYDSSYKYGDGRTGVYRRKTVEVGSFPANAFGLYDMHGNVWEWCQDWYSKDYYKNSPDTDPRGPETGITRILRGGSWYFKPGVCRSANRYENAPNIRLNSFGFRVVLSVPSPDI